LLHHRIFVALLRLHVFLASCYRLIVWLCHVAWRRRSLDRRVLWHRRIVLSCMFVSSCRI
jgi:hypothetical protein